MKYILTFLVFLAFVSCKDQKSSTVKFENNTDIGACAIAGSIEEGAVENSFLLSGSGDNIWFDRDAFHFAFFEIEGDVILRAGLKFIGEGVNAHRKCGWMLRGSEDPGAAHISATVHGDGLTGIQYRMEDGGEMNEQKSIAVMPDHIQLERSGAVFTLTTARDGRIIDTVTFKGAAFPEEMLAGLFICSHDNEVLEKVEFTSLEVWLAGNRGIIPFEEYLK